MQTSLNAATGGRFATTAATVTPCDVLLSAPRLSVTVSITV